MFISKHICSSPQYNGKTAA